MLALTLLACPGNEPDDAASHTDLDYLFVRIWPTPEAPEDFPEHSVTWLRDRPSFGIAFSGGGTRSATATLGQLRALDRLGWLAEARYLTASSGASWTAVPFTYLPAGWRDEEFLGEYVAPEHFDEGLLEDAVDDPRTMASAIYHARIADLRNLGRSKAFTKGDESYSDLVGRVFLDPFALHERHKFFTFEPEALPAIRRANPALSADDFIPISRKRPYLIVAGTLLGRQIDTDSNERYFFEATPLYVGTRAEATVRVRERLRHKNVLIGGGYVESFGYDSYPPEGASANGVWRVRLKGRISAGDLASDRRYRFSLSDMIGMSSAAPLVLLTDYNVPNAFFPEFRHWAIDRERVVAANDLEDGAGDFQHGDGGDTDNLALLPLLARQVENIVVFVNTATPFPDKPDCTAIDEDVLVDDVISFFRPIGKLTHNHAFDRAGLAELCRAFERRRQDGEPLVHCQEYSVLPNSPAARRYSIPAYVTDVCWVYLDAPRAWLDRLPPGDGDLADLRAGEGDFDHFPHYKTFGEHGVGVIDLDRERVHALSNLTAWAMLNVAGEITAALANAGLPGPAE
jgi:hypothetical protein